MEIQHKLVLSKVFRPKYRYEGDAAAALRQETDFLPFEGAQIPYRTYLLKPRKDQGAAEEVLVRVFYCHGNNQDLYGEWGAFYRSFFKGIQKALEKEMPDKSFTVFGMVWDYPLYGLSSECRDELVWSELPEKFLRQAVFAYEVLRARCTSEGRVIDIVYGYSLGSAAASRVFSTCSVDILMLQAPFSKFMRCLKNVSAFTKWLVPEYFDNPSEIASGPKEAIVLVDVATNDEIFEAQTVVLDFKAVNRGVDNGIKISTFPVGHEDFLTPAGVENACRTLADYVFDQLMDHVFVTVFPTHIEDSIIQLLRDDSPETQKREGVEAALDEILQEDNLSVD